MLIGSWDKDLFVRTKQLVLSILMIFTQIPEKSYVAW